MFDQTDIEILNLLKQNSRMQWQEIGELVHLTGQAVKNRINRLEKQGIIEGYTIKVNRSKIEQNDIAFVTVFMKTTDHASFKKYLEQSTLVSEAHRISGEGCYLIKVQTSGQQELVDFLNGILKYGSYKVNLSIEKVK
jgi:Lrp/AsnC family leucine-responsive transcriptional regulator